MRQPPSPLAVPACWMYVSWDRFIGDTMEKLFALAIVMVIVAFAVVYTIAALNGPSKV